jgi:hypothetical protein
MGAVVEWDEFEWLQFTRDPAGELGRTLMTAIGEIVVAGAKRRAEVRTGAMRDQIRFEVGTDPAGVFTDIISPVRNPKDNFPYAIEHERKQPRDRRPHRSLQPALNDIPRLPGVRRDSYMPPWPNQGRGAQAPRSRVPRATRGTPRRGNR